jgi:hypothetical protein
MDSESLFERSERMDQRIAQLREEHTLEGLNSYRSKLVRRLLEATDDHLYHEPPLRRSKAIPLERGDSDDSSKGLYAVVQSIKQPWDYDYPSDVTIFYFKSVPELFVLPPTDQRTFIRLDTTEGGRVGQPMTLLATERLLPIPDPALGNSDDERFVDLHAHLQDFELSVAMIETALGTNTER